MQHQLYVITSEGSIAKNAAMQTGYTLRSVFQQEKTCTATAGRKQQLIDIVGYIEPVVIIQSVQRICHRRCSQVGNA